MATNPQFPDTSAATDDSLRERASDVASRAAEKLSDIGRSTADAVSAQRGRAASGLESAASSMHSAADHLPGGEAVSGYAHAAADTLSSTADYVRTADMTRLRSDMEGMVNNHPGPTLLAAAFVGFLVGRTLSTRD
jgi:ElaB/YqjD/DUF883 family membrane-anchored ribosome-binding protein